MTAELRIQKAIRIRRRHCPGCRYQTCIMLKTEPTPREMQILRLIVEGFSNKRIAVELGNSEQTIKNHVSGLMIKFNAQNRSQLAVIAIRTGVLK